VRSTVAAAASPRPSSALGVTSERSARRDDDRVPLPQLPFDSGCDGVEAVGCDGVEATAATPTGDAVSGGGSSDVCGLELGLVELVLLGGCCLRLCTSRTSSANESDCFAGLRCEWCCCIKLTVEFSARLRCRSALST
jgi:hypothetical protein